MKYLHFLFRIGFGLFIAFAVSFSAAVIFFDYSGYQEITDRIFLATIPTLAITFILFEASPKFWNWLTQRQVKVLTALGTVAMLVTLIAILPYAISRVY